MGRFYNLTVGGASVITDAETPSCGGRMAPGARPRDEAGHLLRHLRRSSSGWAIACPNPLPRDLGGVNFSQRLGVQTWQEIAGEYDRHVLASSSLMTEDVIRIACGLYTA